jgi:hypothetical protein
MRWSGLTVALLAATYQQAVGGVKRGNFFAWIFLLFGVKSNRSLKQRKKFSATIAVKCQGTRCESGTVAPL